MENVILAIDCSGSTGGRKNYWDKSLEIYEKLCTTYGSENVKILFWDDRLEKNVSSLSFLSRVKSCRGGGGTEPYVIASAEILPENSNVVIITDGEVSVSSVEKCDNIVKGRPFKNVTVWFINNGGNMNLSVSTPFTRNCENVTINVRDSQNDNVLMKGNTRNELSIQKYYDNPELFLSELQAITGVIMLQNIGKTNILLRNSLLDLQKNLLTTFFIEIFYEI